jgi:hypothetical protein
VTEPSTNRAKTIDGDREQEIKRANHERVSQRLAQVHKRLDQAYQDKISWEFSMSGRARNLKSTRPMSGSEQALPKRLLDASRILDLFSHDPAKWSLRTAELMR